MRYTNKDRQQHTKKERKKDMKKSEILEYGKTCNFELDKEVKDLSGNTFFSLRNATTDLTPIYRDQKDGNFFLMGLYPFGKTDKLMELLKNRR